MRIKMIQASVAAAAVLVPMAVAGGHVEAKSHPDPIRISWNTNLSVSNYTDCPVAPADVDCIGTQIVVEQSKKRVGQAVTRTSQADVASFVVHFHSDGSFEIEPDPFATGSGPVRLDFDDLEKAQVRGTVPMSDGSVSRDPGQDRGRRPGDQVQRRRRLPRGSLPIRVRRPVLGGCIPRRQRGRRSHGRLQRPEPNRGRRPGLHPRRTRRRRLHVGVVDATSVARRPGVR